MLPQYIVSCYFPRATTAAAVLLLANERVTAAAVYALLFSLLSHVKNVFSHTAAAVTLSLAQSKTAAAVAALALL